jgi:hypothetical protein
MSFVLFAKRCARQTRGKRSGLPDQLTPSRGQNNQLKTQPSSLASTIGISISVINPLPDLSRDILELSRLFALSSTIGDVRIITPSCCPT